VPAELAAGPAVPAGLADWAGLTGPWIVSRVPQLGQAIAPSGTSLPHSVQNMVVRLSRTACQAGRSFRTISQPDGICRYVTLLARALPLPAAGPDVRAAPEQEIQHGSRTPFPGD